MDLLKEFINRDKADQLEKEDVKWREITELFVFMFCCCLIPENSKYAPEDTKYHNPDHSRSGGGVRQHYSSSSSSDEDARRRRRFRSSRRSRRTNREESTLESTTSIDSYSASFHSDSSSTHSPATKEERERIKNFISILREGFPLSIVLEEEVGEGEKGYSDDEDVIRKGEVVVPTRIWVDESFLTWQSKTGTHSAPIDSISQVSSFLSPKGEARLSLSFFGKPSSSSQSYVPSQDHHHHHSPTHSTTNQLVLQASSLSECHVLVEGFDLIIREPPSEGDEGWERGGSDTHSSSGGGGRSGFTHFFQSAPSPPTHPDHPTSSSSSFSFGNWKIRDWVNTATNPSHDSYSGGGGGGNSPPASSSWWDFDEEDEETAEYEVDDGEEEEEEEEGNEEDTVQIEDEAYESTSHDESS